MKDASRVARLFFEPTYNMDMAPVHYSSIQSCWREGGGGERLTSPKSNPSSLVTSSTMSRSSDHDPSKLSLLLLSSSSIRPSCSVSTIGHTLEPPLPFFNFESVMNRAGLLQDGHHDKPIGFDLSWRTPSLPPSIEFSCKGAEVDDDSFTRPTVARASWYCLDFQPTSSLVPYRVRYILQKVSMGDYAGLGGRWGTERKISPGIEKNIRGAVGKVKRERRKVGIISSFMKGY